MTSTTSEARAHAAKTRAEAAFKKEERAKEGAKAMLEYQASGREIRERMARLRALRLAKEAQDQEAGPQETQESRISQETRISQVPQELPGARRKPAARRKAAKV